MLETVKNFFNRILWLTVEQQSANYLSNFDKTIKGLKKLSIKAGNEATKTAEATAKKLELTKKKVEKAKEVEFKAVIKAEIKRFNKVFKAETSRDKTVEKNDVKINTLNTISEKNLKIANKIQELIS